jgi:acyl carrier protein
MSAHANSPHKSRRKTHRPKNDTFERARSVVANHFGVDPGKLSLMVSFIDDLGANSLDAIELIMAFEDEFDLMIPDHVSRTIVTMQDTVNYIQQRRKPRRHRVAGS